MPNKGEIQQQISFAPYDRSAPQLFASGSAETLCTRISGNSVKPDLDNGSGEGKENEIHSWPSGQSFGFRVCLGMTVIVLKIPFP